LWDRLHKFKNVKTKEADIVKDYNKNKESGICANIANVPIYARTQNDEIVVTTSNSVGSTNTTTFYYFMRSITSSEENYSHTFIPIRGIPDSRSFKHNPFNKENYAQFLYENQTEKQTVNFNIENGGVSLSFTTSNNANSISSMRAMAHSDIISEIRLAYTKKLNEKEEKAKAEGNFENFSRHLSIHERSEIIKAMSRGDRRFLVNMIPVNKTSITGTSLQSALTSMYAFTPKQFLDGIHTISPNDISNAMVIEFLNNPVQMRQ